MVQRIIMIVLILVIVLGGGLYAYKELMPPVEKETQAPVYSTKAVVRGNISVGVETIGNLEPSNSGGLRVPGNRGMPGVGGQFIIMQYLVKEGEMVKQGQPVARHGSTDIETSVKEKSDELADKIKLLAEMCQVPVGQIDSLNPARGITITAPIGGRVTNLDINEGTKVELGHTIARIVDDTKFKIDAKLYPLELKKVEVGQKVVLKFPYFDGTYEGTITYINPNTVPYTSGEGFAQSFVHPVSIEGKNMGLIQRDMEVKIGIRDSSDSSFIYYFSNTAKVSGYVSEERVINTLEAIATKVHVDNMAQIKKGDPIVTMSGTDIQDMVQKKLDEIRSLRAELRELSATIEMMEIKAPMDGIVAAFHRPEGDMVGPGEWIGHLYTVSDMRMWPMVDDLDILNVKQGAPVKVTVDAISGKTLKGEVTNVSTMAENINGISQFRVEIKVKGSEEAKAYIDAGSAENVLLIPLEAVFEEDGKAMVEILKPDGTTQLVTVKLGLMNDRVAEVKEGLNEGDLVITGSTADLLPSQHIKSEGSLMPETGDKDKDKDKNNGNGKEGSE